MINNQRRITRESLAEARRLYNHNQTEFVSELAKEIAATISIWKAEAINYLELLDFAEAMLDNLVGKGDDQYHAQESQ